MPAITEENRKWWTLGAMCFALFMVMLDNTVVNIALPAIQTRFDATLSNLSWAVNAYTLVFGVLLVTGGRLGDVFGRKRMFLGGIVVFTLGSIGAGLSQSINELIFFRGVQGAGAAFLMPGSLSIITNTFKGSGARTRPRPVGRHLRPGAGHGPGRGWRAGREGRLGVDLLPERAGGADRDPGDDVRRQGVARRDRRAPDRLGRDPDPVGGPGRAGAGVVQANDYGWTSQRTLTVFAIAVVGLIAFGYSQMAARPSRCST